VTGKHPFDGTSPALAEKWISPAGDGTLETRFRHVMQSLVTPGEGLVVAVSGGMDSVALLHLVLECPWIPRARITVAHFDHSLRRESVEDADFVARLCQRLGVNLSQKQWSNPYGRGNLQGRAREVRYQFLAETARENGSGVVATGHQGDDQAETFLEHLLRGSGIKGLSAMPVLRQMQLGVTLIRPMLFFFRHEIHSWMRVRELEWREDPSNHSDRFFRSRLRHEVVPAMATLAPKIREQLLATSTRMRRADKALAWMLEHFWPTLDIQTTPKEISISRKALVALPDELMVRILTRCSMDLTGDPHAPSARATMGFLHLVRSVVRRWHMRMKGLEISRSDDRIFLRVTSVAPRQKR